MSNTFVSLESGLSLNTTRAEVSCSWGANVLQSLSSVFLRLELNNAGQWPSRNRFGDPWTRGDPSSSQLSTFYSNGSVTKNSSVYLFVYLLQHVL